MQNKKHTLCLDTLYWTQALLDALGYPRQQMGFSHTSPMATQVLQHRCDHDQWASADARIIRQDSLRASQPQAILKLHPPSSLDYKARTDLRLRFFFDMIAKNWFQENIFKRTNIRFLKGI